MEALYCLYSAKASFILLSFADEPIDFEGVVMPALYIKPFFVFMTGGVLSSLGKGIGVASLGALLKAHGFRVRLRKMDPYLNVDPGLMSPYQHGEVYVTEDGEETDLDLGHYERFVNLKTTQHDYLTAGKVYKQVLQRERSGGYQGLTVQVVPHVTSAIKSFIQGRVSDADIVVAEIGGTVGDIEGLPFLEAVRQMRCEYPGRVCFIHAAWVPFLSHIGEFKTKPLQHSVKELQRAGIHPDVLLVRSERRLQSSLLKKISHLCGVPLEHTVPAENQENIYTLPWHYGRAGFDKAVLDVLGLKTKKLDLKIWQKFCDTEGFGRVCIGIVGKYSEMSDAYKSVLEALVHAGFQEKVRVHVKWIHPECLEDDVSKQLASLEGFIFPLVGFSNFVSSSF